MASLCHRCALRLQRAAAYANTQTTSLRAFSSTPLSQKSLPVFAPSANPELNTLLTAFRQTHLIPAYLNTHERRMVRSPKHKQYLSENATSTRIGSEEVPLEYLGDDGNPNPQPLIKRGLQLIAASDGADAGAWQNLAPLLTGAHEGLGVAGPHGHVLERVSRKAVNARQLRALLAVLRRPRETGVSLRQPEVLRYVLLGLRAEGVSGLPEEREADADADGEVKGKDSQELESAEAWGRREAVEAAMRLARTVALMLEDAEHGGGAAVTAEDARAQPEVIAVFLELAAVHAYKYQPEGRDVTGAVKAYAERLLASLEGREVTVELQDLAQQWPMLTAIPIWHGLHLALKVVGDELKNPEQARKVVADLGAALKNCAAQLEAQNPEAGTYNHQALEAWKSCLQD